MSTTIFVGVIIGGLLAGLAALYYSMVKKPHGYVEFKTGLVLKMIPEAKGPIDLVKLRKDYDDIAKKEVKRQRLKADKKVISIPTRHGAISATVFKKNSGKDKPLIVFMHGGGWCIGSVQSHEEQCIRISEQSGLSVLSLEYSLAPEHPYPRAVEECIDAVDWLLKSENLDFADASRLIPMGDSAGGNLSIVIAHYYLKKDGAKGIVEVVPIYPVTDGHNDKEGSFSDFETGYFLTRKLMDAFNDGYFKNGGDTTSALVSPLLHDDFEGFPDTYIITAEFDPLRDEGEAFAEKLKNKGVTVSIKRYKGAIHDFFGKALFGKKGIVAANEMGAYLKEKYG